MPVVASFLVRVSRADASSSASARLSIASLPDPIVETLSADPDIATAASVGSELTGSVLLVVDTMGGHACLRPYDDSEEGHGGSHGRMSLVS